jgi:hypothetical protein
LGGTTNDRVESLLRWGQGLVSEFFKHGALS